MSDQFCAVCGLRLDPAIVAEGFDTHIGAPCADRGRNPRERRDYGIGRGQAIADVNYRSRFRATADRLLANRGRLTSEDVVDVVGLPTGGVKANANNAVGGLMSGWARSRHLQSRIVKSRHQRSNGSDIREWFR